MTNKANKNKLKGLIDLEARDCRWPIGDPRQDGFHFCGARQAPDRPYCAEHWQLAFIPSLRQQRQQAAAANRLKIVAPEALGLPSKQAA